MIFSVDAWYAWLGFGFCSGIVYMIILDLVISGIKRRLWKQSWKE